MNYARTTARRLQESNGSLDGVVAVAVMLIFVFCAAWAPAYIRRCRRQSRDPQAHNERYSNMIDSRMQMEVEMFRRMMEEGPLSVLSTRAGGMSVDDRREYILNCLMTKHIIIGDEEDPLNAAQKDKGDVVIPRKKESTAGNKDDLAHDVEDDYRFTCAICLNEYENNDEISWAHNPQCNHFFHRDCIAEWLLSHEECPCCRVGFLAFDDNDARGDLEGSTRQLPLATPVNNEDDQNENFVRGMRLLLQLINDTRDLESAQNSSDSYMSHFSRRRRQAAASEDVQNATGQTENLGQSQTTNNPQTEQTGEWQEPDNIYSQPEHVGERHQTSTNNSQTE